MLTLLLWHAASVLRQAFSDAIAEYDKTMDIPDPDMKLVKKKQVRHECPQRFLA